MDRRGTEAGGPEALGMVHQSLIDELEVAVAQRNSGSCADVLRRVTDLF